MGATQEDDRFELRGELGAGSSGTVYRVLDRRRGHEVALKVLRRFGGADLYRFKREFRALAGLAHPNLATLHELYAVGEEWMYTMELVDGDPFDRWVRPGGSVAAIDADELAGTTTLVRRSGPGAAVDLGRLRAGLIQLADGLTALHSVHKIHRDLKPSNVLCDRAGRVVILDFGLVIDAVRADRTHDGRPIGTVAYMSPEQAAAVALTAASDWYAVGVMLYEALTGIRPFRGAAHDVLLRKQLEDPPLPSVIASGVPADLEQLCGALLARDPLRRPVGAEVLAALGATPSSASVALAVRPAARPADPAALAALLQALEDSREHFVAVAVLGRAGAGKSALLEQFAEEAELRQHACILYARSDGREQSMFPALDQLIDQLGGVLLALPPEAMAAVAPLATPVARVFPTLRRVPALRAPALPSATPPDPARVLERALVSFRSVIDHLAGERPLAMCVDGAEHTTVDGAATYSRLFTVTEAMPRAMFVLSHRSEPDQGGRALAALRRWADDQGGDVRWIDLDAPPNTL